MLSCSYGKVPFALTSMKRLKPAHVQMIRLFWHGQTYVEIAAQLGYTPQQVMNVLHTEDAREILAQLQGSALDSADEVQQEIALVMPAVVKRKIDIGLYSQDERVANQALTDIMHMGGHSPVKRIQLDRTSEVQKKYADKTEEELRKMISDGLDDDTGPDGRPLS